MAQLALMLFWIALIAIVPFAFWKGGGPERLGAAVVVGMTLISAFFVFVLEPALQWGSWGVLTDLFGLLGFGYISLHSMRTWPFVVAAMQLLSVCAHLVHFLDPDIRPVVIAFMCDTPTFVALLVLLVATLSVIHRRRRGLYDRMWQDWRAISFRQ